MGSKQLGEYPTAFSLDIVKRALGDKGLKEFYQQYCDARRKTYINRPPNALEMRISNAVKVKPYSEVAKEFKIKPEQVYSILNRVSRYQFLTAK